MTASKEKFATQVRSDTLSELRAIAHGEGRQLQSLVDEALAQWLERRKNSIPRSSVLDLYHTSHERFGALYRLLAK
jgi:hypothetical protein